MNHYLTHQIARKTFATTVLLYNAVPIEIVSKLLGNNSIESDSSLYKLNIIGLN